MTTAAASEWQDVRKFFPQIEDDLSAVVWSHAVNNKQALKESLDKLSPIMMLEADVSSGYLTGGSSDKIPIMSHPPAITSDTSLEMWIDSVINANQEGVKKGAKLDFKDLEVVLPSLEILRDRSAMITFPVWLNADILKGPGGKNSIPVDADIFLSLCNEFFPDATLSLGWTTTFIKDEEQKYTDDMINQMEKAIEKNNIKLPLTFPIRASFIGRSFESLQKLISKHPEATITIWTSVTDVVNLQDLISLQSRMGEDMVYIDMPPEEMKKLQELRKKNSAANVYPNRAFLIGSTALMACSIINLQ